MLPCVFCSCGQYTSTEEGYGPNYSEFHYAEFLFCRFKLKIIDSTFWFFNLLLFLPGYNLDTFGFLFFKEDH